MKQNDAISILENPILEKSEKMTQHIQTMPTMQKHASLLESARPRGGSSLLDMDGKELRKDEDAPRTDHAHPTPAQNPQPTP